MYAIAHLDDLGKARFVRDDSGESVWSTTDLGRAKTFDSFDDADGWVISLPVRLSDRIYSRRAYAFDVDTGERSYLESPEPDQEWFDDESCFAPDFKPEPEKAVPASKSRSVRPPAPALTLDHGDQR